MLVKVIAIDRATGKIRLSRARGARREPRASCTTSASSRLVVAKARWWLAPRVRFQKLRPGAQAPRYMSAGAAGLDLASAADEPITIAAGRARRRADGLAFEIPRGFEGQVRPRSGLARKSASRVLNAPGTIDSDYRGEVQVLLVEPGRRAVRRPAGRPRRAAGDRARRRSRSWKRPTSLDDTRPRRRRLRATPAGEDAPVPRPAKRERARVRGRCFHLPELGR